MKKTERTDWLRELGETCVRRMFEMAEDGEALKPELRLQAYKLVAEYTLGKTAAAQESAPPDALEGLSLRERREAIRAAAALLPHERSAVGDQRQGMGMG